jgi:hypothetical protein
MTCQAPVLINLPTSPPIRTVDPRRGSGLPEFAGPEIDR